MPYKHKDAWHWAMRKYLSEIDGTISKETKRQYTYWLEDAGKMLEYPQPTSVPLSKMREYEYSTDMVENSKAVRASVLRTFLRWCGNKDAQRWKISHKQRPKEDRLFLNETDIEYVRKVARSLGVEHELLFTLGIDNGLRAVDMRRLTMENIRQLLAFGKSQILGKGRHGGKPGLLKLNPTSVPAIYEYIKHRRQLVNGHLGEFGQFWLHEGWKGLRPITYADQRTLCVEMSRACGIELRTHDQRASFGHRLHVKRVPIETIAKLLRHESINTSFRSYIGVMDDELDEALAKLRPSDGIQSEMLTK